MEIDIRDSYDGQVSAIRFTSNDVLEVCEQSNLFKIIDELGGEYVHLYKRDIDNLILALQKAKELWGDE